MSLDNTEWMMYSYDNSIKYNNLANMINKLLMMEMEDVLQIQIMKPNPQRHNKVTTLIFDLWEIYKTNNHSYLTNSMGKEKFSNVTTSSLSHGPPLQFILSPPYSLSMYWMQINEINDCNRPNISYSAEWLISQLEWIVHLRLVACVFLHCQSGVPSVFIRPSFLAPRQPVFAGKFKKTLGSQIKSAVIA